MDFLHFIKEKTGMFEPRLLALFVLSGLLNFAIILLIILTISSTIEIQFRNFILFCLCVYAYVRLQKYTMDRSSEMIETLIAETRVSLSNVTRQIQLPAFERMEHHTFHTLLTQEMLNVSQAANAVANMLSSLALMMIAFFYIGFVSLQALVVTLVLLLGGIQLYRMKREKHEGYLIQAREQENRFFRYLNHLFHGFKEIKIHDPRNQDLFHNYIQQAARETESLKITAGTQLNYSIIFAQLFSYLLLSLMIFVLPLLTQIPNNQLIEVVTIILFITTGPLQEIVNAFPFVERANISVKTLNQMSRALQDTPQETALPPEQPIQPPSFQHLRLDNVSFQYRNFANESTFRIGPLNLEVHRGEIVFLMGGNGAGKTTLIKVLTGLYPHQEGTILCNGLNMAEQSHQYYRAHYAAVFQDPHLFDRVYGVDQIDPALVRHKLEEMQIHDKTSISRDKTITNLDLSMGQGKRLA
ncbi:ATP-binding cassette domain-containing protein, partial [bacterium]|nr:ATP-binding cassette domain-containing protein [bacterium]